MGLTAGDRVTVADILHGLLIESGADAATALAVATSGSENKFVALMNEKAAHFGLADTQFVDSIGRDNGSQYSTASDLGKLARLALGSKTIAGIVGKSTYTARAESGKTYSLSNTNLLLGGGKYAGVKTGTTYQAGECLISLYDDGERKILGVVLGSSGRFYETDRIIEWTKRVYKW